MNKQSFKQEAHHNRAWEQLVAREPYKFSQLSPMSTKLDQAAYLIEDDY